MGQSNGHLPGKPVLRILAHVLFFRPIFSIILKKEKQKQTRSTSVGAGGSNEMDSQRQRFSGQPQDKEGFHLT
ncbi:hypothetical protein D7X87_23910 [bacterium D16-54]|nr:hypothetical protein D7X87_23910 [bacterium D16-54]RKJ09994.1 hypothetical protein D7X65_24360 [bacterium D16-56]